MKLQKCILAASCSLLCIFAAQAQQAPSAPDRSESIEIGGVTLQLGMEQDSVIHSLSEYYNLHEIGTATPSESSWVVETKAGPPYMVVANVAFAGRRLSSVYRFLSVGSESHADTGLAGALYGAVEKFKQESHAPCEVTTKNTQQPAGELKAMDVTCGERQKYLSVDIVPTGNGQQGVSLAEVLKYPSEDITVSDDMPVTAAAKDIPTSSPSDVQSQPSLAEKPNNKAYASAHIQRTKTDNWVPPDVDEDIPEVTSSSACPLTGVLSKAGKRVQELVKNVDKFTATEVVEHQSVDKSNQLRPPEIRKFNYLVSIAQLPDGLMNVEEYRDGGSSPDQFPEHIATVGTPSLILIFHPEHANDFKMTCEGLGQWQGQPAWQVRFEERADSKHRMSVFVMSGRAFGVRLRGRAWILADSFQVARLETDLAVGIPEIRLRLQHQDIEYRPVHFEQAKTEMWLPSKSDFYMDFHGHRFYRRHFFTDFKLFSVGLQQSVGDPKESEIAR
jgi:hypothetical protein